MNFATFVAEGAVSSSSEAVVSPCCLSCTIDDTSVASIHPSTPLGCIRCTVPLLVGCRCSAG